ncbi:MAG: alpha/beta hydrolase [Chloroflexaceae bacterium]|nr:alpha/beta hydrolase [Chloroflexaceae bacterium]
MNFSPIDSVPFVALQQIQLPHGRIVYREGGNGFPMIALHGWGASSSYWQWSIHALEQSCHIYAPDLPGYGASPPLMLPQGAMQMARLVIDFADALGIEQFDVNGHSFGAGVALYLAAYWPQRVRKVVLTCFGTFGGEVEYLLINQIYYQTAMTSLLSAPWISLTQPFWRPWVWSWQCWMASLSSMPLVTRSISQPFFYQIPDNDDLLREGYLEFVLMDQWTSFESVNSLGDPALRKAMQAIAQPTLLIGGRQDVVMPFASLEDAHKIIPNSTLVCIDGCGHVPMVEQPDTYNRLVENFLLGG